MILNLPRSALLFTLLSLHALALPSPNPSAEITVNHSDKATGSSSSHTIDPSVLHPDLIKALNGSDININVVTKKARRTPIMAVKRNGVNNSTINLTIVSGEKESKRSPADSASGRNVYIDASGSGGNGTAPSGIVGSTINIHLNSRSPSAEPATTVGDHSIVVDTASAGGISDSTVHVNLLPAHRSRRRDAAAALEATKETTKTGSHSVVINAGSTKSTTTGEHSAVVEASASTDDVVDPSNPSTAGINSSTINLTVISPKGKSAGSKRSPRNRGSDLWKQSIKRKAFKDMEGAKGKMEKRLFVRGVNGLVERKWHASQPSTLNEA